MRVTCAHCKRRVSSPVFVADMPVCDVCAGHPTKTKQLTPRNKGG